MRVEERFDDWSRVTHKRLLRSLVQRTQCPPVPGSRPPEYPERHVDFLLHQPVFVSQPSQHAVTLAWVAAAAVHIRRRSCVVWSPRYIAAKMLAAWEKRTSPFSYLPDHVIRQLLTVCPTRYLVWARLVCMQDLWRKSSW